MVLQMVIEATTQKIVGMPFLVVTPATVHPEMGETRYHPRIERIGLDNSIITVLLAATTVVPIATLA